MNISPARYLNKIIAVAVLTSLLSPMVRGALPQGLSGGASAFQGQDIVGGAAVVFKRPQQVRDIVGGAAL